MKRAHTKNAVGPWAHQKLDGLEAYLTAYTMALSKQSFTLVYIDAFAGAGKSWVRGSCNDVRDADSLFLDEALERGERISWVT